MNNTENIVAAFYKYVKIENPDLFRQEHLDAGKGRDGPPRESKDRNIGLECSKRSSADCRAMP